MKKNGNLLKAKKAKNDEFYTQYETIERELSHYSVSWFQGKTVYCNCDDWRVSNFWKYFHDNFKRFGLKKLFTTGFIRGGNSVFSVYDGESFTGGRLRGNGDFRSEECEAFLREADVVVTNPPFSLFREYVAQLMEHGKKFLIIGNMNAITYKEIFPLIKENKLWLGTKDVKEFIEPNGEVKKFGNIKWFTNIPHNKRTQPLTLYKKYRVEDYPKYDNYDAIEVSKTADIPMDYDGVMGVPISFLDKYCPEQFEILNANDYRTPASIRLYVNGKR